MSLHFPETLRDAIRIYARQKIKMSVLLRSGHEIYGQITHAFEDYVVINSDNRETSYVRYDAICGFRMMGGQN